MTTPENNAAPADTWLRSEKSEMARTCCPNAHAPYAGIAFI